MNRRNFFHIHHINAFAAALAVDKLLASVWTSCREADWWRKLVDCTCDRISYSRKCLVSIDAHDSITSPLSVCYETRDRLDAALCRDAVGWRRGGETDGRFRLHFKVTVLKKLSVCWMRAGMLKENRPATILKRFHLNGSCCRSRMCRCGVGFGRLTHQHQAVSKSLSGVHSHLSGVLMRNMMQCIRIN